MLKKIYKFIAAILISALTFTPLPAQAVDIGGAAAGALGVLAMYKSVLNSILDLGNNVDAQMSARRQDIEMNGADKNPHDVELVDKIMTRLVNNSRYELKVNSLPFVWSVNDSEKFNASCYPMNYVSVNRGLIRALNGDENQIASVLAHEMTHGIMQHSAKSYAKAIAQSTAAMLIGGSMPDSANIDWNKLAAIADYSVAKSIMVPVEHEADAGGFYLMTDAGFNPGGGAAAMAAMDYYLRYETRDFLEFDAHDKPNEQTMNDHPDTEVREEKLSGMLTDYSLGHVKVKKIEKAYKVFIDGEEIFESPFSGNGAVNAAKKAYYFAGGLARAFHDYLSPDDWKFREGAANNTDFLTDDPVYKELREIAFDINAGEKIRAAVVKAYENENPETRKNFSDAETKRLEELKKIKAETIYAKKGAAKKLRTNADTYNDYGKGELALFEIERALLAENQDDVPECLAIRGRAKAICGDYDGALADTNFAVEKDPENVYNFLNRADVRHMRGETVEALADIDKALAIDPKLTVAYQLQANIHDELGETEKAEESYRQAYESSKKNPRSVPENYLEKIDPEAAEKLKKEREKRKREEEKEKLKEEKNKSGDEKNKPDTEKKSDDKSETENKSGDEK